MDSEKTIIIKRSTQLPVKPQRHSQLVQQSAAEPVELPEAEQQFVPLQLEIRGTQDDRFVKI